MLIPLALGKSKENLCLTKKNWKLNSRSSGTEVALSLNKVTNEKTVAFASNTSSVLHASMHANSVILFASVIFSSTYNSD